MVIRAPQVSVNDVEAMLVEWTAAPGSQVKAGQVIGRIETTKAVVEIQAEVDGYFWPAVGPGDTVRVGEALASITDDPVRPPPVTRGDQGVGPVEEKRRWTRKAALLARRYGVRLDDIPAVGTIQEADVERFVQAGMQPVVSVSDLIDDVYPQGRAQRILVLGGGRGAVQILDILWRTRGQRPVGILDDNTELHGKTIMGVPVLGPIQAAVSLWQRKVYDAAVISFSNDLQKRYEVYQALRGEGLPFANVIDPSVQVHANVAMGTGNVMIAGSRIGSCACVGDNNFVSAFCNIEHHNTVGSHCTFGPGVVTSSRVRIGDRVRFGTGIFIEPGVSVGADSIVASGAILGSDLPEGSLVKVRVDLTVRPRARKASPGSSGAPD